ncbi:MAG: hypothetical protein ACR2ID_05135 [Chthoniobacterales bacterium]
MRRQIRILILLAFALLGLAFTAFAVELSDSEKEFLAKYEKVRSALAADDLAAAKKEAGALGEEGAAISNATEIAAARVGFAKLSEHAVPLASGQSGYYVVNCPMLRKMWVQPAAEISNPYAGRAMLNCGVIKRRE